MRHKLFIMIAIPLLLAGCSKTSTTAPSDFTISAPEAATISKSNPYNTAAGSVIYTLQFLVKDSEGSPRNGVDVKFLVLNAALCEDENCATVIATYPYKKTTNEYGVAKVYALVSYPACNATTDSKFTAVISGALESTSASWEDAVTVKKCGT